MDYILHKASGGTAELNKQVGGFSAISSVLVKLNHNKVGEMELKLSAPAYTIAIGDWVEAKGKRFYCLNNWKEYIPGEFSVTLLTVEGFGLTSNFYHCIESFDTVYSWSRDNNKVDTGSLKTFGEFFCYNVNYQQNTRLFKLGSFPEGMDADYRVLSFTNENALSCLYEFCTAYKVRYEFVLNEDEDSLYILNFYAEDVVYPETFSYEKQGGLYELNISNADGQVYTEFVVLGSEDNLPADYPYTELHLSDTYPLSMVKYPDKYATWGRSVKELRLDVKPSRVGIVTSEVPADLNSFIDSDLIGATWSPVGGVIHIVEGPLLGFEFNVSDFNATTGKVTVEQNTEGATTLPEAEYYKFTVGTKYTITGIPLPESYLTDAEARLLTESEPHRLYWSDARYDARIRVEPKFLETNGEIEAGMLLPVVHEAINLNRNFRVQSITYDPRKEQYYDVTEITISDFRQESIADSQHKAIRTALHRLDNADKVSTSIKTSVRNLDTYIDGAFADGLISEAEAKAIEKYINIVNSQKSDIDAQFTALYANSYLSGTAKTNLNTAKTALNTATTNLLNSINTAIADGSTTAAEKADVDSKFTAFNSALSTYQTRVEEAKGAIEAAIEAAAEATAAALDDAIQVGGRNLLLNSIIGSPIFGLTSDVLPSAGLKDGDVITVQVWCSATGYNSVACYRDNGYVKEADISPVNGYGKLTYTVYPYTSNANNNGSIRFITAGSNVRIKVERGNKPTDWTPAPEDVEAGIETAKAEAENAAKAYADTKAEAERVLAEAYADGKVSAEEQARIDDVNNKLAVAKAYADAQDALLKTQQEAYADGKISAAEQAAINAAKAYADLKKAEAQAYADGIVDAEEQRAIADAQAKYEAAKAHAAGLVDSIEIGGRNLIVISTLSEGRYIDTNGELGVSSVGASATDFIKVIPLKNYIHTSSLPISGNMYIAFYDGDKEFVRRIVVPESQRQEYHFKANEGEFFIRVSSTGFSNDNLIKLEKGNKATDWTPAPEDVQEEIDSASDAVNALDTFVNGAFKDGLVSEAEAKAIEKYINIVNSQKSDIDAQFTALYANSYLSGDPKTNLNAAKAALNTATTNLLSSINTAIADGSTTAAEKADVDSKFTAFNSAISTYQTRVEEAQKSIETAIETSAKAYADTQLGNFATTVTGSLSDLQNQIDGNITTWFYAYVPTTANAPANTWTTTALKNQHIGDLFYVNNDSLEEDGFCYRWTGTAWELIKDTQITKALADAAAAQDTADSKRRVFVATPTTPYDIGDLWLKSGDLYKCKVTRLTGSYVASDWEKGVKYTDDTVANAAAAAAAAAQSAADDAQDAADAANALLTNIASDSKLTASEKQAAKKEWDIIQAEKTKNDTQADLYSVSKTAYTNAYNALSSYLSTLLSNLTTTSDITGSEFRGKFKDYYNARTDLLNAISNAAKAAAEATAAALDDAIQVGGRNRIALPVSKVGVAQTKSSAVSVSPDGKTFTISAFSSDTYFTLASFDDFIEGQTYTLSCRVTGVDAPVGDGWVFSLFAQHATVGAIHLANGLCSATFVCPSEYANQKRLFLDDNGGRPINNTTNIVITDIKLELGNKATDWTPAPEDVQAEIDAAAAAAAAAAVTTAASDATAKMNAAKDALAVRLGYTNFAAMAAEAAATGKLIVGGLLNANIIDVQTLVGLDGFINYLTVKFLETVGDANGYKVQIKNSKNSDASGAESYVRLVNSAGTRKAELVFDDNNVYGGSGGLPVLRITDGGCYSRVFSEGLEAVSTEDGRFEYNMLSQFTPFGMVFATGTHSSATVKGGFTWNKDAGKVLIYVRTLPRGGFGTVSEGLYRSPDGLNNDVIRYQS